MNATNLASTSASWSVSEDLQFDAQLVTDHIDAETGLFNTFLGVTGQATITDVHVTHTLTVNNTLTMTANSISVLNGIDDTLYLQPSGLGKIDLLAPIYTDFLTLPFLLSTRHK